jgi:SAM-dependent methyltransferase
MQAFEELHLARYLAAKVSVDDRALNARVWSALADGVRAAAALAPPAILEVGAGIGTMVERLVARGALGSAVYTALDLLPANLAAARTRLPAALASHGFTLRDQDDDRLVLARGDDRLEVVLVCADAAEWLAAEPVCSFDVVLAHAVLDVVDVEALLPLVASRLRPGGLAHASLCFDGVTALEPAVDAALDARIEAQYHATMDARRRADSPSGDSRSGRHLLTQLRRCGLEPVEAGGADWVVFAGADGYRGDEAFFLHYLVDVVSGALAAAPGDGPAPITPAELRGWTAARHAQIDRGELVWIAHNLDVLARAAGSTGPAARVAGATETIRGA